MSKLPPFRHILVIEDEKARRIVALEEQTYSLGRDSGSDIVIYDRVVSRHHATLLRVKKTPSVENYSYRIIDGDLQGNKSTNGLIINGKPCESHNLKHGDLIIFGGHAKASYYILSNALEIALFNPIDQTQLAEILEKQSYSGEPTQVTLTATQGTLGEKQQPELVRLASFPELSPNPIIEVNFQGEITYVNPAANLKFNKILEEKFEHPILSGLLAQSLNTQGNLLLREVTVGKEVFEQYVHYLPESQLIRSYIFDITERKLTEQKLKYQSFHDALTDLPNRAWLERRIGAAISNAQRQKNSLAVIFLDLDSFKDINDTFGHSFGDHLLQNFAKRLSACVREGDLVFRWGGDEFVILVPQIKASDDTIRLAQRIAETLKTPFDIKGQQIQLKTSMGIAIYPQDGADGETLLKNADAALYRAKEQGRNNYQFYSTQITSKASVLLKLESLLHKALENQELTLYYQPQVKLKTGEITGMEALLRWYHPELGNVAPSKLIPMAEKTDLIIPIGQWVLETACKQGAQWQQCGLTPIVITVNFSPRQLQQPNLGSMISQTLEKTGLSPELLEVEVTEETIMHNEDLALQVLEQLHQMGINLSLDDFGAGYSPLSYLPKFPFNTLKIGQSFIQSLSNKPEELLILSTIINLGHSLKLRVVAEGVETLQQLELLQRLHCEQVQGFWFSRPLKAEDATKMLQENSLSGGENRDWIQE